MNIHLPFIPRSVRQTRRCRRRAAGFTLVEMLVTMAVSLILISALAQAYAVFGTILAEGRAVIELSGSLRSTAHQLQQDLDQVTVPVRPWSEEGGAEGYFEYIDGVATDKSPRVPTEVDSTGEISRFGDTDDVLAFTTQNPRYPFVGVVNGNRIQSPNAEIVWWCQESEDGFGYDIYRRTLLVRPDLGVLSSVNGVFNRHDHYTLLRDAIIAFSEQNDVSFRVHWWLEDPGTGMRIDLRTDANINNPSYWVRVRFIANSLADLTRRENRYAHRHPFPNWVNTAIKPAPFPFELDIDMLEELGRSRPQDLVLANAFALDVQAFDPGARVYSADDEALVPSDLGYVAATSAGTLIGRGSFVDLGYGVRDSFANPGTLSVFSGTRRSRSQLSVFPFTYCTWSTHYERDDFYQPGSANNIDYYQDAGRDRATTGFAYDGQRETSPPYPHPLRGVQIGIRVWDPDSRQVRQATVVSNFVPE
jgi:prepilin-type N-terminal cleavage/methylation domain-containing protein